MVAHAELRLLAVPEVRQRNGHDCGPAAARSVLMHFGRPIMGVDRTLRATRANGTPPDRMAWLMVASGLPAASRAGLTVYDLRDLCAAGKPVLCPVQYGKEGHWVAVRGVGRGRVFLMDPGPHGGLTDEPADEFLSRWHDTTADGVKLARFGIAVG